MANKDYFTTYHPIINFIFFIGAIICGMFFIHPVFVSISILCASLYLASVRGKNMLLIMSGMIGLFCIISVINPLFNTNGEHILFHLFERPYTMEALLYGMTLAGMLIAILLWFVSYQAVMTSDKFLYLFGRFSPAFSLMLTMILRLIPNYQRKMVQLSEARKSVGKSTSDGTRKEKTMQGIQILSMTTSWALEGGIVMADSMQSRGYGCGKRTQFSIYRFVMRDKCLLGIMCALLGAIFISSINGATGIVFTPTIAFTGNRTQIIGGAIVYMLFLLIPTLLNLKEKIVWYILRSKI